MLFHISFLISSPVGVPNVYLFKAAL